MKFPEYWLYWTYLQPGLLKSPLQTVDLQEVTVIDPGRQNGSDGPDFLQAELAIAGMRYCGDVEFHLSAEDWYRHGHDRDARYGNVRLHIIWDDAGGIAPALRGRFPHLVLRRHLALPEAEWRCRMEALENEAAPAAGLNYPTGQLIPAVLADLAQQRFQRKVDRYRYWCEQFSPADVLLIALAETLGYARNRFPFRQLFWKCPPSRLTTEIPLRQQSPLTFWLYWGLRGGLLGRQPLQRSRNQSWLRRQQAEWHALLQQRGDFPVLALTDWRFKGVRPWNNPYLRLAALAQLLYRYQAGGLFQRLLDIAVQRLPYPRMLAEWGACLMLPLDSRLEAALRESPGIRQLPGVIVGQSRARQFFLNALLPVLSLWAERSGNRGFRDYLAGCYENFPATEDARLLQDQIRRVDDAALRRSLQRSAFYQQGLLEALAVQSGNSLTLPL